MDMPVYSQANRAVQVTSPFGADTLLLAELSAAEKISQLFQFDLTLLSEKADLQADDILGKPLVVTMTAGESSYKRYFHGLVTDFAQTGYNERLHEYRATVRPWLWFLTRTADCRIYQDKTVPAIFQEVCRQAGFSDFRLVLRETYQPWEYCVQYRETDFNFLSRLLEQEGIFYFFEHTRDKHVLVLCDDATQLKPESGYESVPYFPPTQGETRRRRDHLSSWAFQKSFQPGMFATREYDFKTPAPVLAGTSTVPRAYGTDKYEVFEYPGEVSKQTQGEVDRVSTVRMQELQTTQLVARGSGDAAGLATGKLFNLAEHPRADQNIRYLIGATSIGLRNNSYQTGEEGSGTEYRIALEAFDLREPFRPVRVTPKPIVQGTQTAVVVGPSSDEIYTDKFGRVKVQFHWDRYGKSDANSSCWIRVAQPWAGKGWGAIQIPRIGQEVVVSFLEGDPDCPLIVGSVYNGANNPPYTLPDNKTQSGVKSRSSLQGTADNCNEIRFEDKKGAEQLLIHAERNQDIEVENDETHTVGHDRKKDVKHDETVAIGNDRKEDVKHDETINIGNDRTESVTANERISIGKDQTVKVGKDHAMTVGAAQTLDVAKDRTIEVGANQRLNVARNLIIDAGDSITITTGNASISMRKDGTISISGRNISINGSGTVNVKASGDVIVKGSKVLTN